MVSLGILGRGKEGVEIRAGTKRMYDYGNKRNSIDWYRFFLSLTKMIQLKVTHALE